MSKPVGFWGKHCGQIQQMLKMNWMKCEGLLLQSQLILLLFSRCHGVVEALSSQGCMPSIGYWWVAEHLSSIPPPVTWGVKSRDSMSEILAWLGGLVACLRACPLWCALVNNLTHPCKSVGDFFSHFWMMGATVMFWVAVCKIGFAWCPSDIELFHPVFQPPTLTVTPFASLLLDSTLCKPFCCDVVSLDSSWWLRMLECVETIFYGDEFMCVHVNGYHFRLSCTAHDAFNGLWEDMNWCIELSVVRGPKKDVACCSASGIWNDIKGSVWLSLKDHVTCPAPDFWCWIACCAFQDMLSGLPGLLWYALWHLVSQIVECMQQGVIHFLSYEEELSDDSLDKFGLLLCWWCTVVIFNTLDLGSMVDAWWFWWTFEVLFWFSCFQFAQCILNALIHWANDFTSVMIPVQMHPCALLSIHVTGHGALCLWWVQWVIKVLLVLPLSSKVIDNEFELDGSCLVAQQTWCELALTMSIFCKVIDHILIGNPSGVILQLRQSRIANSGQKQCSFFLVGFSKRFARQKSIKWCTMSLHVRDNLFHSNSFHTDTVCGCFSITVKQVSSSCDSSSA